MSVLVVDAAGVLVGVTVAVRLRDDRRGQAGENETNRGLHDCWERFQRKAIIMLMLTPDAVYVPERIRSFFK